MQQNTSRARSRYSREEAARAPRQLTRRLLFRLGLFWGTLFALSVGGCTVLFWFTASASGWLNLGQSELYLVRAAGLVGLMLGALGVFIIVSGYRRVALPMREMMEAAERVADGDYDLRVVERGPREFRSLARAFNRMAEQLRNQDDQRRNLIANIAYELRTPLSQMQENIEGLVDGNLQRDDAHLRLVLSEMQRLSRLADDLRMLALAESGELILQREVTDLGALVRDTLALFHREASEQGVALRAEIPDTPLYADVDPVRIHEVLGNLLLNAVHSNNPGGEVSVGVSALSDAEDGQPAFAQISLAHADWTISPEALPFFFNQFWRADAARTHRANGDGAGLELAIAKELIEAHGGTISVSSERGRGSTITLALPLEAETNSKS